MSISLYVITVFGRESVLCWCTMFLLVITGDNGADFWAILGFSGLELVPISFIEVVEDPYLADNPN